MRKGSNEAPAIHGITENIGMTLNSSMEDRGDRKLTQKFLINLLRQKRYI
jgi:hypothetical protein